MTNKLKENLEADFPGKLTVTAVPVDPEGPRGKVYTISINGDSFFDFAIPAGGAPTINKAPSDAWKTPLNFETHADYFGPGKGEAGGEAKDSMYEELKAAVAAQSRLS